MLCVSIICLDRISLCCGDSADPWYHGVAVCELAFSCCSSREHAEAIAFYRAGGTERELVTSRLQALLSSRSVLIWWQRNLEAFQLSYQCVVNADPIRNASTAHLFASTAHLFASTAHLFASKSRRYSFRSASRRCNPLR